MKSEAFLNCKLSNKQVKTLKSEREALQKTVYALEDALTEEKEKAKNERENYTGTSYFISKYYFVLPS
jgi:Tfp pilus assembly protein PilF